MVGIAAKTSKDGDYERSSANNPLIKYMLKAREQHASELDHDYSHVFRAKTRVEMFRLSVIAMAIELAYAAETSFVSPILLQIGIDHKLMTMAWGFSPLIGFFISPLLGSISDRCTLSWGRRRPIITILSVGILLGLILVPHGKDFGLLLGDVGHNVTATSIDGIASNYSSLEGLAEALQSPMENTASPMAGNFKYAAILTIIGMILLDLSADTCQTPARTYMLDMCTPEDQARGMTSFTLLAGVGGCVGYGIGGIDWEMTSLGMFMGGNIPTVFGIVTIIFIVCFIITITTFREIPLKLIESDNMLKPLSDTEIRKEMLKNNNSVYYIKQTNDLENKMAEPELQEKYSVVVSMESYQNGGYVTDAHEGLAAATSKAIEQSNSSIGVVDEPSGESPITLRQYLKSIFVMPSSMRILSLTNLFCWMGHVTYCLYFTDFVGEAVFHGDPAAPPNSEAANLYEEGVRFGCWGMAIYAFSCSVYSMTVTKLMKCFGKRTVYIAGILYYGIGMLILGIWPTKWGVLVFSTSAGILYGTLFTMPYILVAAYHSKNCFRVHNGETVPLKQSRGLGTDVAIISSMVFIAQLIVSLSVGPLVSWMQTTCAILYASSVLAFVAAFFAMFVLYV